MDLYEQLTRDEGLRLEPYKDSRGFNTVGIGHNLDANPLPNETYPLTLDRAKEILDQDVCRIKSGLITALPWFPFVPGVYRGVLINMAFNLGVHGLLEFHHMLAAVRVAGWEEAAKQMQASSWYTQVGDRAKRLVKQMQTGEWQ